MTNPAQLDIPGDVVGDCWTEFSNFWTESIPTFFTETIPQAFQNAWDATAEWVDTCVKPFFDDCAVWFEENAAWLWPAAIAFVAGLSFVVGIALLCLCCQNKEEGGGDGDPITKPERKITPLGEHKQAKIETAKAALAASSPEVTPTASLVDLNYRIKETTQAISQAQIYLGGDAINVPIKTTKTAAKNTLQQLSEVAARLISDLSGRYQHLQEELRSIELSLSQEKEQLDLLGQQASDAERAYRSADDRKNTFETLYQKALSGNDVINKTYSGITADSAIRDFEAEFERINDISLERRIEDLEASRTDGSRDEVELQIQALTDQIRESNRAQVEQEISQLRTTITDENRDVVEARILALQDTITDGNEAEIRAQIQELRKGIIENNNAEVDQQVQALQEAIRRRNEALDLLERSPMGQLITQLNALGEEADKTTIHSQIKKLAQESYEKTVIAQYKENKKTITLGESTAETEGSRLWHAANTAELLAIYREKASQRDRAQEGYRAKQESLLPRLSMIQENLRSVDGYLHSLREQIRRNEEVLA